MSTLHIHLDESGDFRFTPKGSKYYVFAAVWTFHPQELATSVTNLRFSLLKQGYNLPCFHAAPDQQRNRDAMVNNICAFSDWYWVAVVVDKHKVNPIIREPHKFYPKFAAMPLRFILKGRKQDASKVLIYTDTLPVQNQKESVEKAIKTVCREELSGIDFHTYHHPTTSNVWLQVADYCAWATQRKWRDGDTRTYEKLANNLAQPELEALKTGDVLYY